MMSFQYPIISIVILILTWLFFFKLFTTKSKPIIALLVMILAILVNSYLSAWTYDTYAKINKNQFMKSADGMINLVNSPLKIPNESKNYCQQLFTDENGKEINLITSLGDNSYCGYAYKMYEQSTIFIPYKKQANSDVVYWMTPETKIIQKHTQ